ncbi:hypothetical protein N431DRAFT_433594 [Stipitochalara longipes BDJ]|nr:hypothetical protein N431DRAFT_433594 [Stipitochalara longipes BDJ]
MPFDPEGDLYTAEPKLLSIDCFPTFFPRPAPPDYDLIMAASTRYHRVPGELRPSMDASPRDEDLGVLLIDPHASDDEDTPPSKEHRFSIYPTAILRSLAICVFTTSFVLLIVGKRTRSIAAIVFIGIAIVRNFLVVIHHIFSKHLRLEFRHRSPRTRKSSRKCPEWVKHGRLHLFLDLVLVTVLFITTIVSTQAPYRYRYYYYENTPVIAAGCILAFIGILCYSLSIPDLGRPSNITISGGIAFSYHKNKQHDQTEQPQVYRDVEASGGLGVQSRKTGADSPIVV